MTTPQMRKLQYSSSDDLDYHSRPIGTSVSTLPQSFLVNEPLDANHLAGPSIYKSPGQGPMSKYHLPSMYTQQQITPKCENILDRPVAETIKSFQDHDTVLISKSKEAEPRIKNGDNEIKASLHNSASNTLRPKPSNLQLSSSSPLIIQEMKVDLGISQLIPPPESWQRCSPTILPSFVRSPYIKEELSSLDNRQNVPLKNTLPVFIPNQSVLPEKTHCSFRSAQKQEVFLDKDCLVPSAAPVQDKRHQSLSSLQPQLKRHQPASLHPPASATPTQIKTHQSPDPANSQGENQLLFNSLQTNSLEPSIMQTTPRKPPRIPVALLNGLRSREINKVRYTALKITERSMSGTVVTVVNDSGQSFACKIVSFKTQPKRKIHLLNEIKIIQKLKESNWIIQIISFEVISHFAYIVMEHGEINFQALISNQDPNILELDFVQLYWKYMLGGVQFIHDNNIVHTNLKPQSFILVNGRLKLIDIGLACNILKNQTGVDSEEILEYVSPEAIHRGKYSSPTHNGLEKTQFHPSCDIWSLGCILYFMTYKYAPFSFLPRSSKILCLKSNDPASCIATPSSLIKNGNVVYNVPDSLISVIQGCLKNNPAERFTIQQLFKLSFFPACFTD